MLEIYFSDLNKEAQAEILEFYDIVSPEEANLDIAPLFILESVDE